MLAILFALSEASFKKDEEPFTPVFNVAFNLNYTCPGKSPEELSVLLSWIP